jgi:hypothetical protein
MKDALKKLSCITRGFTLTGILDALWLRLCGRELLITGHCNGCGDCCRRLSLYGDSGWLRNMKDFQETLRDSPEYSRFSCIGKDEDGFLIFSCDWCGDDGLCRDYEHRLPLCRNFPEKSLRFCGGSLPVHCSYSISEVRPFAGVLAGEIARKKGKR